MQVTGVKYSNLKPNQTSVNLTRNNSNPSFGWRLKGKQKQLLRYLSPEHKQLLAQRLMSASLNNLKTAIPSDEVLNLILKIAQIQKVAIRHLKTDEITLWDEKIFTALQNKVDINDVLEQMAKAVGIKTKQIHHRNIAKTA